MILFLSICLLAVTAGAVIQTNELHRTRKALEASDSVVMEAYRIKQQQEVPVSPAELYPKYYKDVSNVDAIDVYMTHELFGIDDPSGVIQHASKKLLLSGVRTGGKTKYDDIREARDSLSRWLEIHGSKRSGE